MSGGSKKVKKSLRKSLRKVRKSQVKTNKLNTLKNK